MKKNLNTTSTPYNGSPPPPPWGGGGGGGGYVYL